MVRLDMLSHYNGWLPNMKIGVGALKVFERILTVRPLHGTMSWIQLLYWMTMGDPFGSFYKQMEKLQKE